MHTHELQGLFLRVLLLMPQPLCSQHIRKAHAVSTSHSSMRGGFTSEETSLKSDALEPPPPPPDLLGSSEMTLTSAFFGRTSSTEFSKYVLNDSDVFQDKITQKPNKTHMTSK